LEQKKSFVVLCLAGFWSGWGLDRNIDVPRLTPPTRGYFFQVSDVFLLDVLTDWGSAALYWVKAPDTSRSRARGAIWTKTLLYRLLCFLRWGGLHGRSSLLSGVRWGIMLIVFGVALLSLHSRAGFDAESDLFIGTIAIALGVGFELAAGATYFLSRSFGLLNGEVRR
jgi:hypothetical protein